MLIQNKHYRSIWLHPEDNTIVQTIDQRRLPFEVVIVDLKSPDDVFNAIKSMLVRGAPLVGATGAFGMYLTALTAERNNIKDHYQFLKNWKAKFATSRPTAVNLQRALDIIFDVINPDDVISDIVLKVLTEVDNILEGEIAMSKQIGNHGLKIIKKISAKKNGAPVNILTHCNAGWIACIDYGTATAPIYTAAEQNIAVHVWVDETRPRNQGTRLTAWELNENNVPHLIIVDNAGGHLMQHGLVDLVIVGADRTTRKGDVANKIGTYLKALAAWDNNIPFYVALPSSTIDWEMEDGVAEIPIEERAEEEVVFMEGVSSNNEIINVKIAPDGSRAVNHGFDVTPARLITGLITEKGICEASEEGLLELFPENRKMKK